MTRLLLVEDDAHIANGLKFNLELEGYEVSHASDGKQARTWLFDEKLNYDLILLDIMLPHYSGFDLCHALRKQKNYTPILILTARNFESDKIKGLRLGADDYLTKPFNLEELLTRIQVLLRRQEWHQQQEKLTTLSFGNVQIDFERFEVLQNGQAIKLTPLELKLIRVFAEQEGLVLSRDELLEQVWDIHDGSSPRTVDNFVMRLRKIFETDPAHPRHFHAIRGVGYKFTREQTAD
ncbi:DNA-binding response regulator [bacterium (Candidatus Blackallbacteria) CG17_big_fil_post_rev_8_21_14_2_50_48_46]|uniref:DNA-binding response regulator n=1 Tax=bacterium (Candidatus Blackallbacteria) CG17_big_fil_post_rev_8_21_14_2_50_48_46 TaxID=2014261 RepID=A0A2M7G8K5_9BACT|nr:MAG: DNA-binding response regulator [bacterium (Candidatus Blackallbacteria) CG18_big_fil_WC_8_21_14_2_50_49_26]PIW18432.1 MAG: DNA-binding response regulator [bacterium (Candidatus Blackallbacteria) CG17_big_fil_post_rev_8_21_14_2_50_48_46]PIW46583.1 MAG: DNA-binding response regulator [bacterium (Candidatus Blackallbacteria) CG13_big_fil_rev_8_21_14_2_50_49_14]